MSNQNITNLIDSIEIGDSIGLEQTFVAEMEVRLAAKLDQFKQEVSQNLFKESVDLDEEFTEEEIDQIAEELISEISKGTLGSYINKASDSAVKNMRMSDIRSSESDEHRITANTTHKNKELKKIHNDIADKYADSAKSFANKTRKRLNGIRKATEKLTKEQAEIVQAALVEKEKND